ncbi:TPA: nuclear transport factor 2 family protein [Legionella anisa]|uniref:nuclear transport factor 2 family protein n=1 Tax=Legionella anisa TaxID=28082 RepID=UPI00197FA7A6|nr:nuclear transport factor 2 family protein [Legionella anisa]MBN5935298.1 nuclear transport factor 2 family protein [Legionella anisa]
MQLKQLTVAQQLFKRFCYGYNERDLNYLRSLFSGVVIMWGSGIDEYRIGILQIEEQFLWDWEQYDDSQIKLLTFIPTMPNSFWAGAHCEIKIWIDSKNYDFQNLRSTICIDLENDAWKITHLHISFPLY